MTKESSPEGVDEKSKDLDSAFKKLKVDVESDNGTRRGNVSNPFDIASRLQPLPEYGPWPQPSSLNNISEGSRKMFESNGSRSRTMTRRKSVIRFGRFVRDGDPASLVRKHKKSTQCKSTLKKELPDNGPTTSTTQAAAAATATNSKLNDKSMNSRSNCNNLNQSCSSASKFEMDNDYVERSKHDDVTMDELAAYFDDFVHIPKNMSTMAEMMYT